MAGLERSQELCIEGIETPRLFYLVLNDPAPLAGMSYPGMRMPWRRLYALGFRHVVCLCNAQVDYNPAPLRMLRKVEMEDLHHGNGPLNPAMNEKLVLEAVEAINARLDNGEGVAVHCVGGTGRTGTVIGCVLPLPRALRWRGYRLPR